MIKYFIDKLDRTIEGWAFDSKNKDLDPIAEIYINGSLYATVPCDLPREDVRAAHGIGQSGFSISIEDGLKQETNEVNIKFVVGTESYDGGTSLVNQAKLVLFGKNGWLFLYGDSNRALEQMSGEILFSDNEARSFRKMQISRYAISKHFGFKYICFIVPDKAAACREFLPEGYVVSDYRIATQVLNECQSLKEIDFVFYGSEDINQNPTCFYKSDNHLNSIGCMSLFQEAMRRLEVENLTIDNLIIRGSELVNGDLGGKIADFPGERATSIRFISDNVNVIYDSVTEALKNHAMLTGNWVHTKKDNAILDKKVLIFGTSSCYKMLYWFANIFKEVRFV